MQKHNLQNALKKRCVFMYDQPHLKKKFVDLRTFEEGERVCIRKDDGTLTLGDYVGFNTITSKLGKESIILTVHTIRQDGEKYEEGIDGDPFRVHRVGKYNSTKKGGRTRRNRRRKATRRYSSYSSNKISTFSAQR